LVRQCIDESRWFVFLRPREICAGQN
jgi:hypothetical protein